MIVEEIEWSKGLNLILLLRYSFVTPKGRGFSQISTLAPKLLKLLINANNINGNVASLPGQQVKVIRKFWNFGTKKEGINPLFFRVVRTTLYNSGLLLLFHQPQTSYEVTYITLHMNY